MRDRNGYVVTRDMHIWYCKTYFCISQEWVVEQNSTRMSNYSSRSCSRIAISIFVSLFMDHDINILLRRRATSPNHFRIKKSRYPIVSIGSQFIIKHWDVTKLHSVPGFFKCICIYGDMQLVTYHRDSSSWLYVNTLYDNITLGYKLYIMCHVFICY